MVWLSPGSLFSEVSVIIILLKGREIGLWEIGFLLITSLKPLSFIFGQDWGGWEEGIYMCVYKLASPSICVFVPSL